jgi:predicted nucleic acid-binding protein
MRVLVDTSVWVDFFNGFASPEAAALAQLIREEADVLTCGVVATEVLQGFRDPVTANALEGHFCDMEWLTPEEPTTYLAAARLYRDLRARGVTVRSTIDCAIVQLAASNGALVLSKDRDIRLLLDSGLVDTRSLPVI